MGTGVNPARITASPMGTLAGAMSEAMLGMPDTTGGTGPGVIMGLPGSWFTVTTAGLARPATADPTIGTPTTAGLASNATAPATNSTGI